MVPGRCAHHLILNDTPAQQAAHGVSVASEAAHGMKGTVQPRERAGVSAGEASEEVDAEGGLHSDRRSAKLGKVGHSRD